MTAIVDSSQNAHKCAAKALNPHEDTQTKSALVILACSHKHVACKRRKDKSVREKRRERGKRGENLPVMVLTVDPRPMTTMFETNTVIARAEVQNPVSVETNSRRRGVFMPAFKASRLSARASGA